MNSETSREPIVILISGRGSNMRALAERSFEPAVPYMVRKVLSDRAGAAGLSVAQELGIPTLALPAGRTEDRSAYDDALAAAINDCSPTLIVLAGFMRILSAKFVQNFTGKILNIHPSLLPKFPGLHTHRRALEAREAEHGATVHFVTEQLDGGPPIIQARVAVTAADDELSLSARIQALEHKIYPLAVCLFCEGRLRYESGQAVLDGRVLHEPIQYSELGH